MATGEAATGAVSGGSASTMKLRVRRTWQPTLRATEITGSSTANDVATRMRAPPSACDSMLVCTCDAGSTRSPAMTSAATQAGSRLSPGSRRTCVTKARG